MNAENLEEHKLTIGLPVYNEEQSIRKTLNCIMENIEDVDYLIISDNNSTDSTSEICKEFCKKSNKIIYHRNPENIGAWQNMTELLSKVRTEYYMQLGGHDYLSPDSIRILKERMTEDTVCCFPKLKNQLRYNVSMDAYIASQAELASDIAGDRVVAYLSIQSKNAPYYGIMRTSILKDAFSIYEGYKGVGVDNLMIAYMSSKGKLKYISEVEITILARKESQKQKLMRYRNVGMDVPYINPRKQYYQYIMRLVNSNKELLLRKKEIKQTLNKNRVYGNDLSWLIMYMLDKVRFLIKKKKDNIKMKIRSTKND